MHAIKITLGYKNTKPNILIMTNHLIRVHLVHASQPCVYDMMISYQDKQCMTLQVGSS
uniref:Uncharacterized protein n=1 Tax=Octopus bimaculoides TaxID=37653 RepID=A0A0L8I2H4_OCTBM